MKRVFTLFFALALIVPIGVFAQGRDIPVAVSAINLEDIEGRYFTGGGVNFGLSSSGNVDADDPNLRGFGVGVDAYVGKFATNRLAYGLNLRYDYESTDFNPGAENEDDEDIASQSVFGVGAFGRAYSNPCAPNVNGYIQGEIGAGFGNSTWMSGGMEFTDQLNTFHAGIRPGIVVYPTDHIMLEMQYGFLGYRSSSTTGEDLSGNESTTYDRWGGFDFNAKTLTICLMYMLPYPSVNDKMNGSFDGFGKL